MKASKLYGGYPHRIPDKRILEIIYEYTQGIIDAGAEIKITTQLSALIQLGQYELEKRQVKRVTRASLFISFVSIVIAGVALNIAVKNTHVSDTWKNEQINILKEIKNEIVNIKKPTVDIKKTAKK